MDGDGIARWIYDLARLDAEAPPGPSALAKALGIELATAPRGGVWGQGTKIGLRGQRMIWIAPRLAAVHRAHAIAHEIVEWMIPNADEATCDEAAAAILAPRRAFARALRDLGDDLPALADAFRTTESCVALRLGEVTGEPIALVSRRRVRVRGAAWGWPAEEDIRRIARGSLPPELRAMRLQDDDSRVFLRARDFL